MALTVASMLAKMRQQLVDETDTYRWSDAELVGYLNEAVRAIVAARPDASSVREVVNLVGGSKQALPANRLRLLEIECNMGTGGATPGRAVTLTERENLDQIDPNWRAGATSAEVKHYCYSDRDPKNFDVYPPQPAVSPGSVRAVMSALPTAMPSDGTGNFNLDDIYEPAAIHYGLGLAFLKDAEGGDDARATLHMRLAGDGLGVKFLADSRTSPRKAAPPTARASEA